MCDTSISLSTLFTEVCLKKKRFIKKRLIHARSPERGRKERTSKNGSSLNTEKYSFGVARLSSRSSVEPHLGIGAIGSAQWWERKNRREEIEIEFLIARSCLPGEFAYIVCLRYASARAVSDLIVSDSEPVGGDMMFTSGRQVGR